MTFATLSRGDGWCKLCSHLGNELLEVAVLTFVGRATSKLRLDASLRKESQVCILRSIRKTPFRPKLPHPSILDWAGFQALPLPGVVVRSMLRD